MKRRTEDWSILTKKLSAQPKGNKNFLVRVEFKKDVAGCPIVQEIAGSILRLRRIW